MTSANPKYCSLTRFSEAKVDLALILKKLFTDSLLDNVLDQFGARNKRSRL